MVSADLVETKSAFARRCEVSPGRVTQWIDEKKISGAALVGEGRSAKIRVEVAVRQLKLRRDVGQALGNGSATRLKSPPEVQAPAPPPGSARDELDEALEATGDRLDTELKREKLWAAQAARRETERKEALEEGRLVETAAVRRQLTTIALEVMRVFEGALPEMASELAARFEREEREVLQLLNSEFRKIRERGAEIASRSAQAMPATVAERTPAENE